jgi:hypothetical protein
MIDTLMGFHIGQHVICISDQWSRKLAWRAAVQTFPRVGAIYAIRDICVSEGVIGLMFEEIWHERAWFSDGFVEPAFNAKRFRPVRKSNIDSLKKMLEPAPKELIDA